MNFDLMERALLTGEVRSKREFWQRFGDIGLRSERYSKSLIRAGLMPEARAALERLPNADQAGERAPSARLTAERVRRLRTLAANGVSHSQLARDFGVSRVAVIDAVKGRTWQHV